jgi:hypothetical protein
MKNFAKIVAVALIGSSASLSVSALPYLDGSISMSTSPGSSWTGDGGNVNTIASVVNFGVSRVDGATGDFLGAIGGLVTWGQPLSFAAPAVNNPLWTTGGFTFNIDAGPSSVNRIDRPFPQPDTLSLAGSGTVTAPGFDATVGGWAWSGTMDGKATFSFQSATLDAGTPTGVPDGGSTLALFGVALSGIGLLRRHSA